MLFSLTKVDFCHLLITFTNSLVPDQAAQYVGPILHTEKNGYFVNLSRLVALRKLIRTLCPVSFFVFMSTFVTC